MRVHVQIDTLVASLLYGAFTVLSAWFLEQRHYG